MHIIVCLDNNFGMLFNNRRQSRDRKVLEDIDRMTAKVWIQPFSQSLFSDSTCSVTVDDLFLSKAESGDFCFAEADRLMPYQDKIESIIAYRWNRDYPSEFGIDIPLAEWNCIKKSDFAGYSHERITKEIYVRK